MPAGNAEIGILWRDIKIPPLEKITSAAVSKFEIWNILDTRTKFIYLKNCKNTKYRASVKVCQILDVLEFCEVRTRNKSRSREIIRV